MKTNKIFTAILAGSMLVVACRNDDDSVDNTPKGAYDKGFLLANEGNFGTPNASITYVSQDLSKVENNIYSTANGGAQMGDVLQQIAFSGDKAYLVINNSNKIVVANRYTMKKVADITTEINQPRYVAFANNQMYVTNDAYGGAKFLSIYKTSDNSFVKKITFTDAAERVVEAGGKIFVQNATYGYGNKISVVETSGNTVASTITVPAGQINKTISANGNIYTITSTATDSYIYQYNSAGSLVKTTNLNGLKKATNLEIEGSDFYFTSGNKIYKMAMSATTAPTAPLITVTDNSYSTLYGMSVADGKIFTADANGFTADSKVSVYSTTGTLLKTFDAGRGTNAAYVNN